jgi:hypothetical protein
MVTVWERFSPAAAVSIHATGVTVSKVPAIIRTGTSLTTAARADGGAVPTFQIEQLSKPHSPRSPCIR